MRNEYHPPAASTRNWISACTAWDAGAAVAASRVYLSRGTHATGSWRISMLPAWRDR